jgi:hypothetical protein
MQRKYRMRDLNYSLPFMLLLIVLESEDIFSLSMKGIIDAHLKLKSLSSTI